MHSPKAAAFSIQGGELVYAKDFVAYEVEGVFETFAASEIIYSNILAAVQPDCVLIDSDNSGYAGNSYLSAKLFHIASYFSNPSFMSASNTSSGIGTYSVFVRVALSIGAVFVCRFGLLVLPWLNCSYHFLWLLLLCFRQRRNINLSHFISRGISPLLLCRHPVSARPGLRRCPGCAPDPGPWHPRQLSPPPPPPGSPGRPWP